VVGAGRIWLAIAGPDAPAGAQPTEVVEQRDIAPTIVKLMGIDPGDYRGATGKPIAAAFTNGADVK
ncbi:MAG: hypothetical protein ABI165_13465, partial [Bryobacteraceae bacterium]